MIPALDPQFTVEVVYTPQGADTPWRCLLTAQPPYTANDALIESTVLLQFPEIDLAHSHKIGVFGKLISLTTPLKDQDRLEIYRPLAQDPKSLRIKRARDQQKYEQQSKQARRLKSSYHADA